jgi:hypothetical protein
MKPEAFSAAPLRPEEAGTRHETTQITDDALMPPVDSPLTTSCCMLTAVASPRNEGAHSPGVDVRAQANSSNVGDAEPESICVACSRGDFDEHAAATDASDTVDAPAVVEAGREATSPEFDAVQIPAAQMHGNAILWDGAVSSAVRVWPGTVAGVAATAGGWRASASSSRNVIEADGIRGIVFKAAASTSHFSIGWTSLATDETSDYHLADFSVCMGGSDSCTTPQVRERGQVKYTGLLAGNGSPSKDIWSIEINRSSEVEYKRNGHVYYTSSRTIEYPWHPFIDVHEVQDGTTVHEVHYVEVEQHMAEVEMKDRTAVAPGEDDAAAEFLKRGLWKYSIGYSQEAVGDEARMKAQDDELKERITVETAGQEAAAGEAVAAIRRSSYSAAAIRENAEEQVKTSDAVAAIRRSSYSVAAIREIAAEHNKTSDAVAAIRRSSYSAAAIRENAAEHIMTSDAVAAIRRSSYSAAAIRENAAEHVKTNEAVAAIRRNSYSAAAIRENAAEHVKKDCLDRAAEGAEVNSRSCFADVGGATEVTEVGKGLEAAATNLQVASDSASQVARILGIDQDKTCKEELAVKFREALAFAVCFWHCSSCGFANEVSPDICALCDEPRQVEAANENAAPPNGHDTSSASSGKCGTSSARGLVASAPRGAVQREGHAQGRLLQPLT